MLTSRAIALLVPIGLSGCFFVDKNHCTHNGGSSFCTEEGFPHCSVCETSQAHKGCVAELPPADCRDDQDVAGSSMGDADTGGTAGTASDDTDGSGSASDSGESCSMEGLDASCPADAPYCIGGMCGGCDAGADDYCASLDAANPVCGEFGSCTQCSDDELSACSDAGEPFCDAGGSCSGCTRHAQCEALSPDDDPQGCNLETGACLDGLVFWVDPDACNTMSGGFGTKDDPYCEIATALSPSNLALDVEDITVRLVAGSVHAGGFGLATAGDPHYVALVGDGGRAEIAGTTTGVTVSAGANRMFLDRLEITGTAGPGVRCSNSGRLWLQDVEVHGNEVGLLATTACRVRTDGALVHGNSTLGLEIDGAQAGLRIVNTAVVSNGTADAMAPGGISIVDTDGWQIVYSTVAGNRGAADGVGTELTCNAGSTGDARNSIFMGESTGNDVSCPNGLFANSAIDQGTAGGMAAGENITDLPYQPTRFEDLPAGNFHVRNPESSELVDLALWQGSEGDPLTDFDGDVRPLVEGALDWVGADRP